MKKADQEKYRKLLLEKKKQLLEEMGILLDSHVSTTVKDATGDLSSYSYHMADQGTDNMERELGFMFASKSGRLVYHIDEALHPDGEGYVRQVRCLREADIQSPAHRGASRPSVHRLQVSGRGAEGWEKVSSVG